MALDIPDSLASRIVVGLGGPALSGEERSLLSRHPPAGVILFERNVEDAEQLCRLTSEIKNIVRKASGLDPLIAADHEGGRISVLSAAIGAPPSQMAAARAGDKALLMELFRENARRMASCGMNTVLGPVADINSDRLNPVIGTRSFGEDMETVSSLVAESVKALRGEGIVTCLKHFPGHGASSADSHLTLPYLTVSLDRMRREDVIPFVEGFAAGADSVMVGHLAPGGRSLPASLDPGIVTGLLREEIGFAGVVVTDAMEMAGVQVCVPSTGDCGGRREPAAAVLRALEAGNDLLLFSRPLCEVCRGFEELVRAGRYVSELFAEPDGDSRRRIERLRMRASRAGRKPCPPDGGVGAESGGEGRHAASPKAAGDIYRIVAERAAGVIGDPRSAIRAFGGAIERCSFFGERSDFENRIARGFVERFVEAAGCRGEGRLPAAEALPVRLRIRGEGGGAPREILEFRPRGADESEPGLVHLLIRRPITGEALSELCSGAAVVVVADWPYAADLLPPGRAAVVTYGICRETAEVVLALLSGR